MGPCRNDSCDSLYDSLVTAYLQPGTASQAELQWHEIGLPATSTTVTGDKLGLELSVKCAHLNLYHLMSSRIVRLLWLKLSDLRTGTC